MRPAPRSHLNTPADYLLGELGSVRVLRTLATLGGQAGAPFISERSGLSRSSTHYALERLSKEGVVEVAGSGSTRLYALNRQHFLASALVALFDAEHARVINTHAEMLVVIAHTPAILAAWIFGSVARSTDHVLSDFDLAVVIDADNSSASLETLRAKLDEIGERHRLSISVLGFTPEEFLEIPKINPAFWEDLTRDANTLQGVMPETLAIQLRQPPNDRALGGRVTEAAHG